MRLSVVFTRGKNMMRRSLLLALCFSAFTVVLAQGQWHCATSKAQFSTRRSGQTVALENKMYVLNGFADVTRYDNWCSSDGVNWSRVADSVVYPIHSHFPAVVLDGYIWILGGHQG